ncbi:hypothetical protein L9F63_004043, partial [Diploptera punctata]
QSSSQAVFLPGHPLKAVFLPVVTRRTTSSQVVHYLATMMLSRTRHSYRSSQQTCRDIRCLQHHCNDHSSSTDTRTRHVLLCVVVCGVCLVFLLLRGPDSFKTFQFHLHFFFNVDFSHTVNSLDFDVSKMFLHSGFQISFCFPYVNFITIPAFDQ